MRSNHFLRTRLIIIFSISSLLSFSQPQTSKENAIRADKKYTFDDSTISVYERVSELGIDDSDWLGENNSSKKYYYIPKAFKLERKRDGKPSVVIADDVTLWINIIPVWADKSTVVSRISRGGINPLVNPSNVSPLSFYDVVLTAAKNLDEEIHFNEVLPNAYNLNEPFTSELKFDNKAKCLAAYDAILDGSLKLKISIAIRFWSSTAYSLSFDLKEFFNSDAYRDFISPTEGNTIWLFKLQACRDEIESQLKTKIVREGISPLLESDLQKFFDQVFDYRTRIISFDSLCENSLAKNGLTDFYGITRYNTDQIKTLAEDAEHLSDNDFSKKYHSDLKNTLNETSTNNKKAKGGFGFKQILNLNGDYDSQKSKAFSHDVNKILDDEKKLRKYLKESFHYELEGNIWKPKGIIAKEVISSNDVLQRKQNQVSILYTQGYEYKTYSLN